MLRIGSLELKNWLIMAPMAGITNLPFRLLVKRLGAGLVTTEMVSAMGLVLGQNQGSVRAGKSFEYLQTVPEERPLSVQIFGARPEIMAEASMIAVEAGANIVDINMGCPVKKVIKTGAGGALLRDPQKVKKIVSSVRRACPVPLTVKIRAGWSPNEQSACDIARLIEDCGADAITVHPRSVIEGFSGRADWTIIAKVKQQLQIPCIGNGDVFNPFLALEMKRQTGCAGVMIGRAAISNPWIFKQILQLENGIEPSQPELQERRELIIEHFRLLSLAKGENRAARIMRGLLLRYTKGLSHSRHFRSSINSIGDYNSLIAALDQYLSHLEEKNS